MENIRDAKLPVLNHHYSLWRDKNIFHNKILFAIQPLFGDSYGLLMCLQKSGLEIFSVIGLEYSSRPEIKEKLQKNGIRCTTVSTNDILAEVTAHLTEVFALCESTGKRLLILENGGYAVPLIHEQFAHKAHLCAGAVEETKQGLWKDQKISTPLFPILQTADTPIKKIESAHIGEPVVMALSSILKKAGLGIQGKKIGVLGYGWIGSSVARVLKMRSSHVLVYDKDPIKNIEAYYQGCVHGNRDTVLQESDIIIGATGQTSVSGDDFLKLKSGVFLASASSKKVEFDINYLEQNSYQSAEAETHIKEFHLTHSKKIVHLLAKGEPINFLVESLPHEIMDLMMADMYLCLATICTSVLPPILQPSGIETELGIAQTWLIEKKIF
jgi:adenosylhomocysteinase